MIITLFGERVWHPKPTHHHSFYSIRFVALITILMRLVGHIHPSIYYTYARPVNIYIYIFAIWDIFILGGEHRICDIFTFRRLMTSENDCAVCSSISSSSSKSIIVCRSSSFMYLSQLSCRDDQTPFTLAHKSILFASHIFTVTIHQAATISSNWISKRKQYLCVCGSPLLVHYIIRRLLVIFRKNILFVDVVGFVLSFFFVKKKEKNKRRRRHTNKVPDRIFDRNLESVSHDWLGICFRKM